MNEIAPHTIETTVLWNGGWDTFLIDLNETTDAPPTALEADWWKHHADSTFHKDGKHWMMCRKLNHAWFNDKVLAPNPAKGAGVHPDTKGVRILKHLGGGD